MAVTAQQVKELRELTDCGIMDCKKALIECDGDIEKAKGWLREKGMAKAEKKSARIAAEGAVVSLISDDKKTGVLVEINIETDFAANTDKFKNFTNAVATHILTKKPATVEELMAQPLYSDESKTVEVFQKEAIADIGENTSIRRFVIYEVEGNGAVASYIHMGGKVGVFVEVATSDDSVITKPEFDEFAKNIGMQVAASRPGWVEEKDVPQSELDKETEILKKFGAFVQLEPDLDALCHVSQISSRRLEKPEDALSVGQVVQAKVIKIEPEERRISISIKEVAPIDPELPEEAAEEAPAEEAAETTEE